MPMGQPVRKPMGRPPLNKRPPGRPPKVPRPGIDPPGPPPPRLTPAPALALLQAPAPAPAPAPAAPPAKPVTGFQVFYGQFRREQRRAGSQAPREEIKAAAKAAFRALPDEEKRVRRAAWLALGGMRLGRLGPLASWSATPTPPLSYKLQHNGFCMYRAVWRAACDPSRAPCRLDIYPRAWAV